MPILSSVIFKKLFILPRGTKLGSTKNMPLSINVFGFSNKASL